VAKLYTCIEQCIVLEHGAQNGLSSLPPTRLLLFEEKTVHSQLLAFV